MKDKELLEMAAKAAEIDIIRMTYMDGNYFYGNHVKWDPLTDNGDALRLAVKLSITPVFDTRHSMVHADPMGTVLDAVSVAYGTDPYAATRRAIVRAAAEIGKFMP